MSPLVALLVLLGSSAAQPAPDPAERLADAYRRSESLLWLYSQAAMALPDELIEGRRHLEREHADAVVVALATGDEPGLDRLCTDVFPRFWMAARSVRLCQSPVDRSTAVDLTGVAWLEGEPPDIHAGPTLVVLWSGRCASCDQLPRVAAIARLFADRGLRTIVLAETDDRHGPDDARVHFARGHVDGALGAGTPEIWEHLAARTRGGVLWTVLLLDGRPVFSDDAITLDGALVERFLDAAARRGR